MGITVACLNASGNIPLSMDLLNNVLRAGANNAAFSLITSTDIWFIEAFLLARDLMVEMISISEAGMTVMELR